MRIRWTMLNFSRIFSLIGKRIRISAECRPECRLVPVIKPIDIGYTLDDSTLSRRRWRRQTEGAWVANFKSDHERVQLLRAVTSLRQ